uniref:Archaemetzincin-2 n=1 Tax=Oncorhynchus tshawytscha TaxID=74940 RepID=A0A8C8CB80_ONCTS
VQCLAPPETRRTALVSRRCDLSDRYCKYSRQERRLLRGSLHPGDGSWFRLITVYSDSDWIPSNPYRSTPIKGHSSYGEGETGQYVEWLRDYCQAFFGLMVKLLSLVTTAAMVCAYRVNCSSRNLQIHTGERNHLMAYPGAWARVPLWGCFQVLWPPKGYLLLPLLCLFLPYVCFQTVTHAIGQIFGVKQCQWLQYVMQGSNHLEESDTQPMDPCPLCLRKLKEEGAASHGHLTVSQSDSEPHCLKPTMAFQTSRQWQIYL